MRMVCVFSAAIFAATMALAETSELLVPGGSAVYFPESETMVLFSAVQDQRCPSNADCVWEGMIRVELALAVPGDTPEMLVLCNACEDGTRAAKFGRYAITLIRLEPGREVLDPLGRLVTLQDYTVVLGVEWQ